MAGTSPAMTSQLPTSLVSQPLPGLLPALRRARIGDDIVDVGELDAVANESLVKIGLRYRRHVGDDRPGVAAVEALEHLAVGIDRMERIAVRAGLNGQAAEQRALAVGQAPEQ